MVRIDLRPSRLLAGILVVAHCAAIVLVVLVDLPAWIKVIATAILVVHLPMAARLHALLLAPDAVVAIEISADNILSIHTRTAGWREYDVLASTYVMPYLTILNLRQSSTGVIRRVTLLPDSMHADDFRKLRVWLRWKEDSSSP